MAAKTLSAKEVASELETTPKRLRKFLRSVTPVEERPGKGGRWSLEAGKVRTMRKQFEDWEAANAARAEAAADGDEDDATEELVAEV